MPASSASTPASSASPPSLRTVFAVSLQLARALAAMQALVRAAHRGDRLGVVAEGCDETTCVLENYSKPCCSRWKPKGNNFGDTLEKSQIRSGVSGVLPAVIACGEKSSAKGTVTISVTVAPGGNVTSASVASAPDDALGNCVAAALRRATFAKTNKGGSFSYPFVF